MRLPLPLLFLLFVPASCGGSDTEAADAALIQTVRRGDLVITVRERGELQASSDTRISSELEGRATLIHLIPEGSIVEAGQKLAELDVSEIEAQRASQAISVARAEAVLLQARKSVEIMEKELRVAENTAASRLKIATLRMQKFLGQARQGTADVGTNAEMVQKLGELLDDVAEDEAAARAEKAGTPATPGGPAEPVVEVNRAGLMSQVLETLGPESSLELEMGEMANQVLQFIDEISLARADLELAKETLFYSQQLQKQKFVTRNQLAKDEISYKRQLSQETVAWNNLSLLVKYSLPETLITLEQEVENAQLGLESVRAAGEARRVREQAELEASEAEHRLAREQLDNLEEQILNAVLSAPTPGLVVYGRWDWDEPVFEGMSVRERQEIVILPNIELMQAELKIHEAQIGKLAVGQLATVRADAFPSQTFRGRVSRVATLPEPTRRSSDPKVFAVDVLLEVDNADGLLRPSMNGTVVVDVGTLEDVLLVPLAAIERRGDDLFVWKATADGALATPIRLGGNNLTHVEVLEGLHDGDRIHLVRPPGARLPALSADGGWATTKTDGEDRSAAAPDEAPR